MHLSASLLLLLPLWLPAHGSTTTSTSATTAATKQSTNPTTPPQATPTTTTTTSTTPAASEMWQPRTTEKSDSDVLRGLATSALDRAAKWLEMRRGDMRVADQGWGQETPRAVLAMRAARPCWGDKQPAPEEGFDGHSTQVSSLQGQLALKQLEIDLAVKLLRNPKEPLSAGRLALHTLAWSSACMDPKDFHGHDLVGMLQHSQPRHGFEEALVTLAICSSGSQPRKKHLRHIIDLAHVSRDKPQFYTDTLSMTIVSLRCLSDRPKTAILGRYMSSPLSLLQNGGQSHGNNLFKTCLSVQAMGAGLNDRGEAALKWLAFLLGHQRADGSFGSIFATTEAMMALDVLRGGGGLLDKRKCCMRNKERSTTVHPDASTFDEGSGDDKATETSTTDPDTTATTTIPVTTSVTTSDDRWANITYWLWVGGEAEERHTLEMDVYTNTTFFQVMKMAAALDVDYKFSVSDWPNGHYVHTIGGRREQPIGFHFWLLYELDSPPDPMHKPTNDQVAPAGVDELLVQDGKHYLFWYKAI